MKKLVIVLVMALGLKAVAQTGGYQIGDVAKDFSLKNVDSKMVSTTDFSNAKGFIVVFTCNTCPYSKAYEQRIMALSKEYKSKGYPLIAINPNDPDVQPGDSFAEMKNRAENKKYDFPYLFDPGQQITKEFGAARTPHVYVLKKTPSGNVVEYIGAIDSDTENTDPNKSNYVKEAVNALIAGKKPATTYTKAVGCTIKWKKMQG